MQKLLGYRTVFGTRTIARREDPEKPDFARYGVFLAFAVAVGIGMFYCITENVRQEDVLTERALRDIDRQIQNLDHHAHKIRVDASRGRI